MRNHEALRPRANAAAMSGYERRSSRAVYENRWLRFEAHTIVHPSGAPGEHGLVALPGASAVVVLDGADVVLTRQPRFALDRVVLEIVKGGADPGESPREAAERETREEVGIVARRWDALGVGYELPSIVAPPVHLFLARECTVAEQRLEREESIAIVRLDAGDAWQAVLDGRIDDAITALALARARAVIAAG